MCSMALWKVTPKNARSKNHSASAHSFCPAHSHISMALCAWKRQIGSPHCPPSLGFFPLLLHIDFNQLLIRIEESTMLIWKNFRGWLTVVLLLFILRRLHSTFQHCLLKRQCSDDLLHLFLYLMCTVFVTSHMKLYIVRHPLHSVSIQNISESRHLSAAYKTNHFFHQNRMDKCYLESFLDRLGKN